MKRLLAVLGILIPVIIARSSLGQERSLEKGGIGPFVVGSLNTTVQGASAQVNARIRNDSMRGITYAKFCGRASGQKKGCAFQLWTDHTWVPGEEIQWNLTVPATPGIETSTITLEELKLKTPILPLPRADTTPIAKPDPKFQFVHKVFVEPIEGNLGALTREQLMVALANSGRFEAVDDPALAEAVIKGQAESRETGTASATTNNAAVGGVSVFAAGSAKGTVKTQTLTEKTVAIHLSLPNGEILWGWDGSKPCKVIETKCAIDDLVNTATGKASVPVTPTKNP